MEESKLARWVEEGGGEPPRLVFVIGKGGVGKTTASIILAYELARRNRVLLVSLDQAMHLLEYLGMRKPMKKERIVEGLDAVQVDVNVLIRKESMDYVNLMQSVMPGLTVVNADDVVKSLKFNPGFEEEVYLRYISGLFGEKEYDYIVVDTPPTGVTYRMLRLPKLYMFWVEQLIRLRKRIINLRYIIARTMGRDIEPRDPVLNKLLELKERYGLLYRNLGDKARTRYVCIMTPEPLPLYETENTIRFLEEMKTRPSMIIVNRLLNRSTADSLGVLRVQEEVLSKIKEDACSRGIPIVGIMHSPKPPRRLGEALELLERVSIINC